MKGNFTIGIIGGNGEMGKSLIDFFVSNGVDIVFSDRNTEISNIDVVRSSEIVILAVPLKNYKEVLKEIGEYLDKDKLLMDIGSIKEKQVELMKEFHSGEILATHPLFGPEKNFKGNENSIIVCKINSGTKSQFIIELFKKNNLKIVELSPFEHDKIMAYVHGFYYLMNITYLDILKDKFKNINNLNELMTTSFKKYIENLENIFNTKDWLIELIAYENPYMSNIYSEFIKRLNKKVDIVKIREFLNER